MGHLVDQVEVTALEERVSKSPSTVTTDVSVNAVAALPLTTVAPASILITSNHTPTTTTNTTTAAAAAAAAAPQPSSQNVHPSQQRPTLPPTEQQTQSKPRQRKLQFKLDDEGSPDKKPKERIEEEGLEEEESGWWAERVAMALGGMAKYRDVWYRSHAHLLHGDGPLPHTWRLYIAALAVCRHEVSWLMQALLADFRNAGGNMQWTVGLHHAPRKLYALTAINNILAHRPWLLSSQHIQQLTKGEDSWSLGELCQALCIMTHFHTLATFLHSCKLSSLHSSSRKDDVQANTKSGGSSSCKMSPRNIPGRTPCPDSNPQNNNTTSDSGCKVRSTAGSPSEFTGRSYKHLTVNPSYTYIDIKCEDETRVPSFFIQEYNWQDHGYAMCSRLLGEVGAFFDDRFASALAIVVPSFKDLTSQKKSVDQLNNTLCDQAQMKCGTLLSKALWNHVQWLLGIHNDDCDYAELHKRLDPHIRDFVKTACCFPETLADNNSNLATTNSVQTSMVEMSVIVMEARLQSELLYALRAIMLHHC